MEGGPWVGSRADRPDRRFPQAERYRLVDQITRSVRSIGANLAEGCGRQGDGELLRFARIARGSAHELENHLLVARDLGFIDGTEWTALDTTVQRISSMLSGLIRANSSSSLSTRPKFRLRQPRTPASS